MKKKVLVPIIISVISGIVLWIITTVSEEKVIRPIINNPKPDVRISSIEDPGFYLIAEQNYQFKITVYNEGDAIGKQMNVCIEIFESLDTFNFSPQSREDITNLVDRKKVIGDYFVECSEYYSLPPKQFKELILNVNIKKEGLYWFMIEEGEPSYDKNSDWIRGVAVVDE